MDRDRPALRSDDPNPGGAEGQTGHRLPDQRASRRWIAAAAIAIPVIYLAVFFAWPVGAIIARGLSGSATAVTQTLAKASFWQVLWFTFWQAAASTGLTLVVAAPLTAVMARWSFPGKRMVRALVTIPFVLPTVVVAGAFVALIDSIGGDDGSTLFGAFSLRHSVWAVLGAHVFFNVAVVIRTVGSLWEQLDDRPEQAARTLGASRMRAFVAVTLPRLQGAVLSAVSVVFLFTFTSFAIILLLGGPRRATLETEIYRYAVNRSDFATGAALALVQLIAVMVLVALTFRFRNLAGNERLSASARRPASRRQWATIIAVTSITCAALLAPIATMVMRSVTSADDWSLVHYRSLGDRVRLLPISALDALTNSLLFALVAAGIASVIGGLASVAVASRRGAVVRILDLGLLLPLGTSAVTLGFGMLIALDEPPLDLRQSWIIVPIAQSLIGIPFVVRTVVPVLMAIDSRVREAAATLGADPARVRREIDVPIAARALLVGAGFAFAVSLGEFGATSFVGRRPDLTTMPLAIARLLGQPGEALRGQAMALSVVLMVVTAIAVAALDRSDRGGLL